MSNKKSTPKKAAAPEEPRAAKSAKVAPAKKAPAAKPAAEEATEKLTEKQPKKLSAIDAAAQVLAKAKEPMTTKALVETMAAEGLWSSPGGKTPAQTPLPATKGTTAVRASWAHRTTRATSAVVSGQTTAAGLCWATFPARTARWCRGQRSRA